MPSQEVYAGGKPIGRILIPEPPFDPTGKVGPADRKVKKLAGGLIEVLLTFYVRPSDEERDCPKWRSVMEAAANGVELVKEAEEATGQTVFRIRQVMRKDGQFMSKEEIAHPPLHIVKQPKGRRIVFDKDV